MNFNFYEQFKNYPNIELLKIIESPQDYQSLAIEAAAKILNDRTVSADERAEVKNEIQEQRNSKELNRVRIAAYKQKTIDIFEPFVNPGTEVKPQKWLNIFLMVIAIQFAWILFTNTKNLIYFFSRMRYGKDDFDIFLLLNLLTIIYIPIIFTLLLKRKRWGWILIFADILFVIITSIVQIYFFSGTRLFFQFDIISTLFVIIIRTTFAFFLWRIDIAGLFGIDMKTKKTTALVTTLISLLFIACLEFVFH